ncbi:MAG: hypothetical protein J5I93_19170 [Pirellulaceae bacterium]|nr:hypothetical protein [Pirellulaceae bacterium]
MPLSQQPSFVSATQQALLSLQQASFAEQQLSDVSLALACFAAPFIEQQPAAFVTTAFVGPQHAFASLQQSKPSVQHFCTAAQQPLFSAQHFSPLSQQPSLASATQQALFGVQQASLAEQQSWDLSAANEMPENSSPSMRNEPANSLVNMEFSSDIVWMNHCAHFERSNEAVRPRYD